MGNIGTYLLDFNITRSAAITGIKEVEMNTQISLYPIPANDFVMIDLRESINKINQIDLCDIYGNQLYTLKVANYRGIIRLPLTGISNGVYVVQIHSEKEILIKKMVVEK